MLILFENGWRGLVLSSHSACGAQRTWGSSGQDPRLVVIPRVSPRGQRVLVTGNPLGTVSLQQVSLSWKPPETVVWEQPAQTSVPSPTSRLDTEALRPAARGPPGSGAQVLRTGPSSRESVPDICTLSQAAGSRRQAVQTH